jgi:DNA-binding FadR family transcriptional regulator
MTQNTISHEIAHKVRTDILRERYICGDRLPSERDLASRFDASRGAVREALTQLEQTGLIKIQPGGARVRPIQSASISVLGPLMTLDESPDPVLIDQFLQTFAALSALTAREAINYANNEEMNHLHQMVVSLSKQAKNYEAMQPRWHKFLRALAEIADNLVIHLIGNDLRAQFVDQMVKFGIQPELRKKVVNEVLSTLKTSVTERNGDLAQLAVQQYFDELRKSVTKIFDNQRCSYREQGI